MMVRAVFERGSVLAHCMSCLPKEDADRAYYVEFDVEHGVRISYVVERGVGWVVVRAPRERLRSFAMDPRRFALDATRSAVAALGVRDVARFKEFAKCRGALALEWSAATPEQLDMVARDDAPDQEGALAIDFAVGVRDVDAHELPPEAADDAFDVRAALAEQALAALVPSASLGAAEEVRFVATSTHLIAVAYSASDPGLKPTMRAVRLGASPFRDEAAGDASSSTRRYVAESYNIAMLLATWAFGKGARRVELAFGAGAPVRTRFDRSEHGADIDAYVGAQEPVDDDAAVAERFAALDASVVEREW